MNTQYSDYISTSLSTSSVKRGGWLLSLSDLLTLLLAVILVTHKLQSVTKFEKNSQNDIPKIGTGIAIPSIERKTKNLVFVSSDFKRSDEGVEVIAGRHLKSLRKYLSEAPSEIRVESCSPAVQGAEGESWFLSLAQVMTLHRQYIDTEGRSDSVHLHLLGPECERIRSQGGRDDAVVRIQFQWS
ncbi:MAG: hypothetical protein KDD60_05585 [Bdellovibrionales bacterium]|nr:hypothetical protein [Bdellovibrionales bacterium]